MWPCWYLLYIMYLSTRVFERDTKRCQVFYEATRRRVVSFPTYSLLSRLFFLSLHWQIKISPPLWPYAWLGEWDSNYHDVMLPIKEHTVVDGILWFSHKRSRVVLSCRWKIALIAQGERNRSFELLERRNIPKCNKEQINI